MGQRGDHSVDDGGQHVGLGERQADGGGGAHDKADKGHTGAAGGEGPDDLLHVLSPDQCGDDGQNGHDGKAHAPLPLEVVQGKGHEEGAAEQQQHGDDGAGGHGGAVGVTIPGGGAPVGGAHEAFGGVLLDAAGVQGDVQRYHEGAGDPPEGTHGKAGVQFHAGDALGDVGAHGTGGKADEGAVEEDADAHQGVQPHLAADDGAQGAEGDQGVVGGKGADGGHEEGQHEDDEHVALAAHAGDDAVDHFLGGAQRQEHAEDTAEVQDQADGGRHGDHTVIDQAQGGPGGYGGLFNVVEGAGDGGAGFGVHVEGACGDDVGEDAGDQQQQQHQQHQRRGTPAFLGSRQG